MACEAIRVPQQTAAERQKEIRDALADLEQALRDKRVQVRIGPKGEVCFKDWGTERRGMSDACAYRALEKKKSSALRRAVDREKGRSGKKVKAKAVKAGGHSHDGGKTWAKGH